MIVLVSLSLKYGETYLRGLHKTTSAIYGLINIFKIE